MCGRFGLNARPADIQDHFAGLISADAELQYTVSYNVAPSQPVLVVRADKSGQIEFEQMTWGFQPGWAKRSWINARAETLFTQPAFRKAAESRRALVVASRWYEWQPAAGAKQPYCIHYPEQPVIAFAGIWTARKIEDDWSLSVAIITADADEVSAPIHDRMPLVLDPAGYAGWLDRSIADGRPFMTPLAEVKAEAYPVSTRVNDPKNDDPGCAERIELPGEGKAG